MSGDEDDSPSEVSSPPKKSFSSRTLFILSLGIAVTAVLFGMIYWTHLEINEGNGCGMTYMWRHISMIPINVPNNTVPRYGLFRYHEGPVQGIFIPSPTTIPVLFVPGSGGSANQVRSLASVMQNKTDLRHLPYRYHFYAVNFAEELSFLSGITVGRQRDFVIKSIKEVLKIYNTESVKVHKIVLIGHSFGGSVVYSLPSHPDFNPKWMDLVITIAAPLAIPPISMDQSLSTFYSSAHSGWKNAKDLEHVGIVSYSGGIRDIQVADRMSSLQSTVPSGIFFPGWSLEDVRLDSDHLCILWCNQLVRHQSRVLEAYAKSWGDSNIRGREILTNHYAKELKALTSVTHYTSSRPVLRGLLLPWTEETYTITSTALQQTQTFHVKMDSPDTVLFARIRFGNTCKGVPKVSFRFSNGYRRYAKDVVKGKLLFHIPQTMPDHSGLSGDLVVQTNPDCTYTITLGTDFWWSVYMTLLNHSHLIPSMLLNSLLFISSVRCAVDAHISTKRILMAANVALAAFLAWYSQSLHDSRWIHLYIRLLFLVFLIVFTIGEPLRKGVKKLLFHCSSAVSPFITRSLICSASLFLSVFNVHASMALITLLHTVRCRDPSTFVGGLLSIVISTGLALAGGIRDRFTLETAADPSAVLQHFSTHINSPVFISFLLSLLAAITSLPNRLLDTVRIRDFWFVPPLLSFVFVSAANQFSLELYSAFICLLLPIIQSFPRQEKGSRNEEEREFPGGAAAYGRLNRMKKTQ